MSTAPFLRQSNYNALSKNKKLINHLLKQRTFGSATPYPYLGTTSTTKSYNKDPFLYFTSSNCAYNNSNVLLSLQYNETQTQDKNTLSSLLEEYEDNVTAITYSSSSINLSQPLGTKSTEHPWSNTIKDIINEKELPLQPTDTREKKKVQPSVEYQQRQQKISNKISQYLNQNNYYKLLHLLHTHVFHIHHKDSKYTQPKIVIPLPLLTKLLTSLPGKYLQDLYSLLRLYDKEKYPQAKTYDVYYHICSILGDVASNQVKHHQLYEQQKHYQDIVEHMYRKIILLHANDKHRNELLSTLLISILRQNLCFNTKKIYSYNIYHQLQYSKYNDMKDLTKFAQDMLNYSYHMKYTDIPFCDMFHYMVREKNFLPPLSSINKLCDAYYPFYDNRQDTMMFLKTMEILYKKSSFYKIDISILETMSYTASRFADIDLILYIWDLLDVYGYRPTIDLYENACKTFVSGYSKRDHDVLSILTEMEKVDGFVPSRILIRTISNNIA